MEIIMWLIIVFFVVLPLLAAAVLMFTSIGAFMAERRLAKVRKANARAREAEAAAIFEAARGWNDEGDARASLEAARRAARR